MGMPLRWKTSELLGSRRANAANRLLIGRLLAATAHASASRQSRSRLRQADRGHRRHATLPQSWIQPENWEFETHRSTYASEDYQDLLDAHGITCSMSRRGNCHDNAVIECFFSTLKTELVDRFPSFSEAKMEFFDYIEPFYNQRRRHSTLRQISPAAFERQAVA